MNIPWKIPAGQQSFFPIGAFVNVIAGPLTDVSIWVGFCTSNQQHGVKNQLWYLDLTRKPYEYPITNAKGQESSFPFGI
jgi:hypothetical protein